MTGRSLACSRHARIPDVNISDLRAGLSRALDAAEELLGAEVALEVDYYWHIPVGDAFDLANEPSTFMVGQVSDDLATLRDPSAVTAEAAWHELSHVVGVLRALELAATR
jgi:hypothetical protein